LIAAKHASIQLTILHTGDWFYSIRI